MADELYLIRKDGYYYRPNCQGYTADKNDAGRYTLEDAIRETHPNGPEGPRDGMSYEVAPHLMTEADALLEEAADHINGVSGARGRPDSDSGELVERIDAYLAGQPKEPSRGFVDAIRAAAPNGETVSVRLHANGDWSVYDRAAPAAGTLAAEYAKLVTFGGEVGSAHIPAAMSERVIAALSPTPAADEVEDRALLLKVASAIYDADYSDPKCQREEPAWDDPSWFHAVGKVYFDFARAAIAAMQARSAEPAASAWIVGNGNADAWRTWESGAPEWTSDREKATRYARRIDAEHVHTEDDDAWRVEPYTAEPAPVSREIAEWNAALDAGYSQDAAIARVRALPAEPAGEEPVGFLFTVEVPTSHGLTRTVTHFAYPGLQESSYHNPRWRRQAVYARPATPTNPERLVEDGAFTRDAYALEWIAGARPPVHPNPMKGARSFPSFERALHFFRSQADDAEVISLRQHRTTEFDRTDELRAALTAAPFKGEGE